MAISRLTETKEPADGGPKPPRGLTTAGCERKLIPAIALLFQVGSEAVLLLDFLKLLKTKTNKHESG